MTNKQRRRRIVQDLKEKTEFLQRLCAGEISMKPGGAFHNRYGHLIGEDPLEQWVGVEMAFTEHCSSLKQARADVLWILENYEKDGEDWTRLLRRAVEGDQYSNMDAELVCEWGEA